VNGVKHSQLVPTNIIVSISLVILITLYVITTVIKNLPGGGQQQNWLPEGFQKCGEADDDAYTLPRSRYVILCPEQVDNQDDTVGDRNHDYTVGVIYIDDIKSATSVVLFHEFLHLVYDHISESSS
jgi:hypothetical protein